MGSHSLSPGDLPDPGIEPGSPTLQADSLLSEASRGATGPLQSFSPSCGGLLYQAYPFFQGQILSVELRKPVK